MNNIQEDDWGEDSWSRHSGMPNNDYDVVLDTEQHSEEIEEEEK